MLEAVEGNIHQRLCALLDEHRARYRVMAHEAVGQCEAVSDNSLMSIGVFFSASEPFAAFARSPPAARGGRCAAPRHSLDTVH